MPIRDIVNTSDDSPDFLLILDWSLLFGGLKKFRDEKNMNGLSISFRLLQWHWAIRP